MKQVREAKEMAKAVEDRAKRLNIPVPPYEFLELIGKGSYGRVFKRYALITSSTLPTSNLRHLYTVFTLQLSAHDMQGSRADGSSAEDIRGMRWWQ